MDDEDLETRIVVEMGMTGRDHQFVMSVLNLGQLLSDAVSMVVVDEGDGADYGCIGACRLLGYQAIPNQIAKRLRPGWCSPDGR